MNFRPVVAFPSPGLPLARPSLPGRLASCIFAPARVLAFVTLLVSGCFSLPASAAQYWLAPPGTPNCTADVATHSAGTPLCFVTATVQGIIDTNPLWYLGADTNEVILTFKPGLYETSTLYLGGGPNRKLIFEAEDPNDPPVLRYTVPTGSGNSFANPSSETWLLHSPETNGTLSRFEAHDLILDGNWPAWAATNTHANPANSFVHSGDRERGFKLGGLYARARSGWVRGLQVRNCGALGVTPWPWWVGAGTECFPLWVNAAEFTADAWRIEDCEVRDFHSMHGGYCTAIMVTTPPEPGEYGGEYRVATVQRCQVYGNNL